MPKKGGTEKPVTGNTGIQSGGASVQNTKSFKGMEAQKDYAPMAKTNVPNGGKKGK